MKKSLLILASLLIVTGQPSQLLAQCSVAGTASATMDSICPNSSTTLQLTGYVGNIQWQSYNGSAWIDETGTGATSAGYTVSPVITTDYRAIVIELTCAPDTSNVQTITVGVSPPVTTGATRCGYGSVTLTASGGGPTYRWYDVPTGGTPLASGSSFTTNVASTTTFYASAASNGGGAASAPMPTHASVYTGYTRGYWFTAPVDFTITALQVPTEASTANQSIAVLMYPVGPPPAAGTAVFGFSTLYITQNNPTSGPISVNIPVLAGQHIVIIGNRGNDATNNFAAANSYDGGAVFTTTIDGNSVELFRAGMQSCLTGFDPNTTGILIATGQRGRILFSYEVGCESPRVPAIATVTTPPAITLSANPPALCQGQSSTLSVTSSNSAYTYTWSPATGLSGTTGSTVTASPLSPITYTVIADDGTCGYIDSVSISVGPASVAGTATISTDTICLGSNATLFLNGNTGNIQWQGNNGTGWVNETGTGSTTGSYQVSPAVFTEYRAVVTSGGCDPDTTVTLSLEVIAIADPTTMNDTLCGTGTANLTATGPGIMNWYTAPTGGTAVYTGATYSPAVTATTTYYVEASAGSTYNVGAPSPGIGTQFPVAGADWGMQFDVTQQITLDRVYISPGAQSGNVILNLRASQGGPILATKTISVVAYSGLQPITLDWTINPGTGYRLETGAGSVQLYYNSFGAAYPYTFTGSSVTITGYCNPNYAIGTFYYFFYNWQITEGCKSNRVPATVVVIAPPPTPTISQFATVLTSSAPQNNQWMLNGNPIPGATGTTYDMSLSGAGTYTVVVTDPATGCTAESLPVIYTSLSDSPAAQGVLVYPNPAGDHITIEFQQMPAGMVTLSLYNLQGQRIKTTALLHQRTRVDLKELPYGMYLMEVKNASGLMMHTRMVKVE